MKEANCRLSPYPITNYGTAPVLNIAARLSFNYREVIKQKGGTTSGKIITSKFYDIGPINLGTGATADFYLRNYSPYWIDIFLPQSAMMQPPGTDWNARASATLISPYARESFLPPFFRTDVSDKASGADKTQPPAPSFSTPKKIKRPAKHPFAGSVTAPSVVLLFEQDQLRLYNRDKIDLWLYGDKFGSTTTPSIEAQPREVPHGMYYYLYDDTTKRWALQNIGQNGQKFVPFEMYLKDENSDTSGTKYTAKFGLLITMKDGAMAIDAQNFGVVVGGW